LLHVDNYFWLDYTHNLREPEYTEFQINQIDRKLFSGFSGLSGLSDLSDFSGSPINMPVTKTAKRALKGSAKKEAINTLIIAKLEATVRSAKKSKLKEKILEAVSLADQAAKKKVIHRNKAARIKSRLAKLLKSENQKTRKTPKTRKSKKI
jgi:small subunit ribosomal protein S20